MTPAVAMRGARSQVSAGSLAAACLCLAISGCGGARIEHAPSGRLARSLQPSVETFVRKRALAERRLLLEVTSRCLRTNTRRWSWSCAVDYLDGDEPGSIRVDVTCAHETVKCVYSLISSKRGQRESS